MDATASNTRRKGSRAGRWTGAGNSPRLRRSTLAALLLIGGAARAQQPAIEKGRTETTEDYNRRLEQLRQMLEKEVAPASARGNVEEYQIGAEDLIEITVFEANELNRTLRVSASGEITLPLVGTVRAAGLAPRVLESILEELLRRTYLRDPHVGVFVREMQSHPVSVFGAVKKPGVYQIRGEKTVIEVLALAEGLAEDAGDTVLVERGGGQDPASMGGTMQVSLKKLLTSADQSANVRVHPGDIVKVTRAGIVYVVGEVRKPGGFLLRTNENISVLQALALAEGLTRTSAKNQARIIRTNPETGERQELPIRLGEVLAGRAPDPLLLARDIVFVPNSAAKSALLRGLEAGLSTVTGLAIYRF
jgi:polysaccharide export outer membrane protein